MAILTTVNEQSTVVFTVTFTDEDGQSVVPNTIIWSLVTMAGEVVNSREDVAVSVPAASIDIVLTGDDLAVTSDNSQRALVIEATYDSAAGNDLTLKEQAVFAIDNLLHVS